MKKKILTTVVTSTGEKKVKRSALVEIEAKDISKIEVMHDLLLDRRGYTIHSITLKDARELIAKMYKAFE